MYDNNARLLREEVGKFVDEVNKVYDCNMTKVRLGNKVDGGYVVLKELCERTKQINTFGVGEDVSFELDFINNFRVVEEVNLFDPFIDKLPIHHNKFYFYKSSLVQDADLLFKDDCMFKMDIEWDEWSTLFMKGETFLHKCYQLVIEFHILHVEPRADLTSYFTQVYQRLMDYVNGRLFRIYRQILEGINKQFYLFHIHANNSLPMITLEGYKIPPLLELSFVRKDLVRRVKMVKTTFPIEGLDLPNKIDRPDIINYFPIRKNEG